MSAGKMPLGYRLRPGSIVDEALLISTMQRAYEDLGSAGGSHLTETVRRHLTRKSRIWWVIGDDALNPVGCLWLSEAVDQRTGEAQTYVFLIYVALEHRRRGIGTALMELAQDWASRNGYRSISLQVFETNRAALALYRKLGYETQAVWLTRSLTPVPDSAGPSAR